MYICMCMIEVIDNDTFYYVMLLIIKLYSLFKCILPHLNFNNNPQRYSHTYNIYSGVYTEGD